MDKTKDKFCPQCGHHVYRLETPRNITEDARRVTVEYFCQFCGDELLSEEVIDINQHLPRPAKMAMI